MSHLRGHCHDEPVALQRPIRIPVKLDLLEYTAVCDACSPADWNSEMVSTRAGRYQGQVTGYRAFLPTPLPPEPPVRWTPELLKTLSDADRAVGRLDGLARGLPNPDLFVAMYVRREAVLSSQIEGTQSSLDDILAFEVDAPGMVQPADITETVNYVRGDEHRPSPAQRTTAVGSPHPGCPQGIVDRSKGPGTTPRRVPKDAELDRPSRLHARYREFRTATARRSVSAR